MTKSDTKKAAASPKASTKKVSKKKVAKKAVAKKTVAKKTAATKKVSKKVSAKKAATRAAVKKAAPAKQKKTVMSADQRRAMIAVHAYYKWQQAGCPTGQDYNHWLEAEREIEGMLK